MSQITTHILDTALGFPAVGVSVHLFRQEGDNWRDVATGVTNQDGRVPRLLPSDQILPAGIYSMIFETATYPRQQGQPVFYPYVEVVFNLDAGGEHYHIPLLLSPFGYSTYRGS